MLKNILIAVLSGWLFTSMLVDFVAVPTIFRTLPDIKWAGKVGMVIFSRFNILEIVFGIITVFCSFRIKTMSRWWRLLAVSLLGLVILYFSYLTPTITELGNLLFAMEQQDPALVETQKAMDKFHKLYVRLDGMKILMILAFLAVMVFSNNTKKVRKK